MSQFSHPAVDSTYDVVVPEIGALTFAHRRELFEALGELWCFTCGYYKDWCDNHSVCSTRECSG